MVNINRYDDEEEEEEQTSRPGSRSSVMLQGHSERIQEINEDDLQNYEDSSDEVSTSTMGDTSCDEVEANEVSNSSAPKENTLNNVWTTWYRYLIESTHNMFTTEEIVDKEVEEELSRLFSLLWKTFEVTLGVVALVIIGSKYTEFLQILHENNFWFSKLQEVERELSFGNTYRFYYSFYKQLVNAPTFDQGMVLLRHDNKIEFGKTLDATKNFYLLPEITLAYLYRLIDPQEIPILFYVNSVFIINGFYIAVLYMISWYISGSILSGLLTSALVFIHRKEMTEVDILVPQRESFALPILFLQLLVMCSILYNKHISIMKCLINAILISVLLQTWHFTSYYVTCEMMVVLFMNRFVMTLSTSKVLSVNMSIAVAVVIAGYFKDYPARLLSSMLASTILPINILYLTSNWENTVTLYWIFVGTVEIASVWCGSIVTNILVTTYLDEPNHIHLFTILMGKLHLEDFGDIDRRMYKCTSLLLETLGFSSFKHLIQSGLLCVYVVTCVCIVVHIRKAIKNNKTGKSSIPTHFNPLIFIFCLSVIFVIILLLNKQPLRHISIMAMPLLFVMYGVVLASDYMYKKILSCFNIHDDAWAVLITKIISFAIVISYLLFMFYNKIRSDIWPHPNDLYKMWDPDTVQLTNWISSHTAMDAVFSGTISIMTVVKVSTNRSITSHPTAAEPLVHKKTKLIYQMYGCKSVEEVHKMLSNISTDYIIIEDDECTAPPHTTSKLCRLIDIVDLYNGHKPPDVDYRLPDMISPTNQRFCLQETLSGDKQKLFSLVLSNAKYRVYKVI